MTDEVQPADPPKPVEGRKKLFYRIAFLALLIGGLVVWSQRRGPKTLSLVIDLAEALPGDLTEVDVVVTRGGRAVARVDRRFHRGEAPEKLTLDLRATPGAAEVDATLVYQGKPARRTVGSVVLAEEQPARLVAK